MTTPTTPPTALVTGDLVLDCHLYAGVKARATSILEPGTRFETRRGGTALIHDLLVEATNAHRRLWNEDRKKKKDRPRDHPARRPSAKIRLGLSLPGDQRIHVRSYGVWMPRPKRKGSDEDVWRVEHHFGYGPTAQNTRATTPRPRHLGWQRHLTVIDDGAISFRQALSQSMWPLDATTCGHVLLKMSWPLCRGDFWTELTKLSAAMWDRLIVIVSVSDLRRDDGPISRPLSWERCAESTRDMLVNDPLGRELRRAAHVIVTFQSEGALWMERTPDGASTTQLVFDPARQEGDHARGFDDTVYGFQTCFTAGVAHQLMRRHCRIKESEHSPFEAADALHDAIERGIEAGLMARRRLLELGHGIVDGRKPEFPVAELGPTLDMPPNGLVVAAVPACSTPRCLWTILAGSDASEPLFGLGQLTARYGTRALSHVPSVRLGDLFTVDRGEIEALRTLAALIEDYEKVKVQKKPLSIGVFGPPGAGKSFGVKALAEAILGKKAPFLEFNLSQFKGPDELIGAFHRIRDAVLGGITPVAFWDEFDSKNYEWLQYLLAPMQDGSFQEGQLIHPIGKCIFVFAGGTSPTLEGFGVADPAEQSAKDETPSGQDAVERRRDLREQKDRFREYQLRKGPDFVSRLHGFLNVLGPNPPTEPDAPTNDTCRDLTWPIRRALMLRSVLKRSIADMTDDDELNIDPGLLYALLAGPRYTHGARSLEKIVLMLARGRIDGRLHRAALPPDHILGRDTNAEELRRSIEQRDAFKYPPDLESLARAVHVKFLDAADRSRLAAELEGKPEKAWPLHPTVTKEFELLAEDKKASNRAAARRIAEHLALIGYVVEPKAQDQSDDAWSKRLEEAIGKNLELLAQAEHLGWWSDQVANGWTYHEVRDDDQKRHSSLVEWAALSPQDQSKDRAMVTAIPDLLDGGGFMARPARP